MIDTNYAVQITYTPMMLIVTSKKMLSQREMSRPRGLTI